MAMLSEKKQKNKWSLIPTGSNPWSRDENKVGQKMLEKLGWSKGNGLGKNLDGRTEHVRVSLKMDTKGVGFKGPQEDFSKQIDAFDDVLSALNSNPDSGIQTPFENSDSNDTTNKIQSLETKSKSSKSRVHYHKFTRGKDLSRCTEADFAGIFGCKKRADRTDETKLQLEEVLNTQVGTQDNENGVKTIHGGNLNDYFTQKMAHIKSKRREGILGGQTPAKPLNLSDIIPDLDFEPKKVDFSFNVTQNLDEEECDEEIDEQELVSKKKKKKKSKHSSQEEEVHKDKQKKKKKKNKPASPEREVIDLEDDPKPSRKNKRKAKEAGLDDQPTFPTKEEITKEDTKSKKKKRNIVESEEAIICIDLDDSVVRKKNKKKKKDSKENDSSICEELNTIKEDVNSVINVGKSEKKKRKKADTDKEISLDEKNESISVEEDSSVNVKKSKNKKRKKADADDKELSLEEKNSKNESISVEEVVTSKVDLNSIVNVEKSKKKKGKKADADKESSLEKKSKIESISVEEENAEEKASSKSNDLNDSYCSATGMQDKKKKKKDSGERLLTSKMIKTSSLSLFKVTDKPISTEEPKEGKKKSKLSAKKSFKMLKSDLETRLKLITGKKSKDIPEDHEPQDAASESEEKDSASESEEKDSAFESEEKYSASRRGGEERATIRKMGDTGTLFPGSNLRSIVGYDKAL